MKIWWKISDVAVCLGLGGCIPNRSFSQHWHQDFWRNLMILLCGIHITANDKTWQFHRILVWEKLKKSSSYCFCQKITDCCRILFQFLGVAPFKQWQDNESGSTFYKMPCFFLCVQMEPREQPSWHWNIRKTVCQLTRHWTSSTDSIDSVVLSRNEVYIQSLHLSTSI